MLRSKRSVFRHVKVSRRSKPTYSRYFNSSNEKASNSSNPKKIADTFKKSPPSSHVSTESRQSTGAPKFFFAATVATPAAVALYVKRNPEWNPEFLQKNPNWIKFRSFILSESKTNSEKKTPNKPEAPDTQKVSLSDKKSVFDNMKPVQTHEKPGEATKNENSKPSTLNRTKSKEKEKSSMSDKTPSTTSGKNTAVKSNDGTALEKKTSSASKLEVIEVKKPTDEKSEPNTSSASKLEVTKVKKPNDEKSIKAATDSKENKQNNPPSPIVEKNSQARIEIENVSAELDPSKLGEKVGKKISSTTKEILLKLQDESLAASADIEKNYLKDLQELDANVLALRVAQLAMEMKHRSKWEALRLLESLRRMEEEANQKVKGILRHQDELNKELRSKELHFQEETLSQKFQQDLEKVKEILNTKLLETVKKEKDDLSRALAEKFAQEKKSLEDNFREKLRAKSVEQQETLASERKQRLSELEAYRAQLRALNTVLENTSSYEAFSHQVHKVSVAALALSDRIEAAAPLTSEIRALLEAGHGDVVIEAAVKSLPSDVVKNGAPSVAQLQDRFKYVQGVGRRAALVPENAGIVGQLFGGALSYLLIPPGGPIEGDDAEAIFSRADYALKAGDIEKAVEEMESLKGLPADVSRDWIEAAKSRLAVEQTSKIVKAHISLLAASCS